MKKVFIMKETAHCTNAVYENQTSLSPLEWRKKFTTCHALKTSCDTCPFYEPDSKNPKTPEPPEPFANPEELTDITAGIVKSIPRKR